MEHILVGAAVSRLRLVTVELVRSPLAATEVASSPQGAAAIARSIIGRRDREHFVVMHLNARHRVVSMEIASVGTLSTSLVHPREVFKAALLANASAIICAHNHPSGDASPSGEDRAVTTRLKKVGELIGVPMLDFLVVTDSGMWSARESSAL
tara:strand:+ start:478 stop:936 length:459 start_codon:yes stop_codon:yes gene_type:complete